MRVHRRRSALVYIEVFRGTSLLVQLFWLYYALPLVGISFDPITTGIAGARAQYRGLRGGGRARRAAVVPTQQHEAARALNFCRAAYALAHLPCRRRWSR